MNNDELEQLWLEFRPMIKDCPVDFKNKMFTMWQMAKECNGLTENKKSEQAPRELPDRGNQMKLAFDITEELKRMDLEDANEFLQHILNQMAYHPDNIDGESPVVYYP